MSKITFASIIPLIGGETIAVQQALGGQKPEYLMSYAAFGDNDKHIVDHYKDVPYHIIDEEKNFVPKQVDIVNSVCPCAGLSSLNVSSNVESETNDWMLESTKYVLKNVKPKVLFGENAPRLATNFGKPVAAKLQQIAEYYGYKFSMIKTQSKVHGLPQTRNRSFYFFWQGDKVPVMKFERRDYTPIEKLLAQTTITDDPMDQVVREGKPTDNPFYQYLLQVLNKGTMTHAEYCASVPRSNNILEFIEGHEDFTTYENVALWMDERGHEKEARKCRYNATKLASGGSIMRRGLYIPKDITGAFVGYYPENMVHPIEDRFLTYRECMNIMALPKDFVLQNAKRSINHICQNVPVTTARDMAENIVAYINGELNYVESGDHSYVVQNNLKPGEIELR